MCLLVECSVSRVCGVAGEYLVSWESCGASVVCLDTCLFVFYSGLGFFSLCLFSFRLGDLGFVLGDCFTVFFSFRMSFTPA